MNPTIIRPSALERDTSIRLSSGILNSLFLYSIKCCFPILSTVYVLSIKSKGSTLNLKSSKYHQVEGPPTSE